MTRREIADIVAFLPELESPDFEVGTWKGGQPDSQGVVQMPWLDYSPRALALLDAIRASGLVHPFDWMAWLESPEGKALRDEPGRIETAGEEDLARLLTAIIRGDRFVEGNIAAAIESGVMRRIIRRLKDLASDDGVR